MRKLIGFGMASSFSMGGVEVTMSTPALISDDEFSSLVGDRALVSGRFMSGQSAVGRMNFTPCGLTWFAGKEY